MYVYVACGVAFVLLALIISLFFVLKKNGDRKKNQGKNRELDQGNDGYDYAELTRIGDDDDYDALNYQEYSHVQSHQVREENKTVQNPYYEGAGDFSIINANIEDIAHETGPTENIKVVENPYYE